LILVPDVPGRARASLDLAGAAALAFGLFTLVLAISKGNDWEWTSALVVGLLAAAVASLVLFVVLERRVAQPLVDIALVVRKPFSNANLCSFTFGYAFFIAVFVVPQIAGSPDSTGYGQGLTTTEIGLLLVPTGAAGILGGWLGGRVADSVGPRALVVCGSMMGVAAYVSLMLAHDSWYALSIPTASLTFSVGLILTGIYPVVLRTSSEEATGVAVAIAVVMRNVAVALGVAVAFAIIDGAGVVAGFPAEDGFRKAFAMGAVGAAVASLSAAFMPGRPARVVR
jgi:predicted MFS family arabinose efflux permease